MIQFIVVLAVLLIYLTLCLLATLSGSTDDVIQDLCLVIIYLNVLVNTRSQTTRARILNPVS